MVVLEFKVLVAKGKEVFHFRVDPHLRKGSRFALQLGAGLFQVVVVEVDVPEGMDEFARFEVRYLGDHHGQQGIGGNVEGNPDESVGASLV